MSQGTPTDLVRNFGVESRDPVPDQPFTTPPRRVEGSVVAGGAPMARADDAQRGAPYDPQKAVRAGQDAVNWTGGNY